MPVTNKNRLPLDKNMLLLIHKIEPVSILLNESLLFLPGNWGNTLGVIPP